MSIEHQRREYRHGRLTRASLVASPFEQFQIWLDQALAANISDPTAMTLATVGGDGRPSQRLVLLKRFDHRGLVFYTNLGSRKAQDISGNSRVSLLFPWLAMDRQVIVAGTASPLPRDQVGAYFASRPRSSQLAAWASRQSAPVANRRTLEDCYAAMAAKFEQGEVPLPDFWGGYLVEPDAFEFWQGGESRLHDRFVYRRFGPDSWNIERLCP